MRKHNYSIKRMRRQSLHIFKNKALFWLASRDVILLDVKRGKPEILTDNVKHILADQCFNWSIAVVVCCRDAQDTEYLQSEELTAQHPYKQDALIDHHLKMHGRLVKSCNPQHIVSAGYLASPHGTRFTDEDLDRVFTAQNAWNYHTRYEAEQAEYDVEEISA